MAVSVALGGAATLGLIAGGAAPASAAGEPNTNYTVNEDFASPGGHDLPLRWGRHDNASADQPTGFGIHHIDDRNHRIDRSWPEFKTDIRDVLKASSTQCNKDGGKWKCKSRFANGVGPHGNMMVIYSYDDSHTPDNRPVGIVTAYYLNDSGCFAVKGVETKCG